MSGLPHAWPERGIALTAPSALTLQGFQYRCTTELKDHGAVQLVAVREAYADMRGAAEAAQEQVAELQATERGLRDQLTATTQQVPARQKCGIESASYCMICSRNCALFAGIQSEVESIANPGSLVDWASCSVVMLLLRKPLLMLAGACERGGQDALPSRQSRTCHRAGESCQSGPSGCSGSCPTGK